MTIGKELSHIENAQLQDVKNFFFKHYRPQNAILCVAGNITTEKVKELSEKSEFNKINILSIHLQKQFSHFFNIYAKELFLQKHRKDKLLGAFNSKKLTDESEIRSTVTQIHMLALQEKLVSELTSWKYNSYNAMLSDKPTRLMRKEVIDIFESVDYFKRDHQEELKKSFLTN
jgi:predicted Zn-dependent peptidase